MKKVKILLSAALVGAALFSFAACKQESANTFLAPVAPTNPDVDDDQADSDDLSAADQAADYILGYASNATVNKQNETSSNLRNLPILKTKHYGSRAKIIQENISETTSHGQMGYAFNVIYHKATDKKPNGDDYGVNTADFTVVATTYAGGAVCYISAFRNITNFQGTNFGVPANTNSSTHVFDSSNDPDGSRFRACEEACEYEIVKFPAVKSGEDAIVGKRTANLTKFKYDSEAKTFTTAINVTAETDGSYKVYFYDPARVLKDNGSWISSFKLNQLTDADYVFYTIPAGVTGYNKKTQANLGIYANVYPNQTLKGSWRLSGIKGEAEVEEFED